MERDDTPSKSCGCSPNARASTTTAPNSAACDGTINGCRRWWVRVCMICQHCYEVKLQRGERLIADFQRRKISARAVSTLPVLPLIPRSRNNSNPQLSCARTFSGEQKAAA